MKPHNHDLIAKLTLLAIAASLMSRLASAALLTDDFASRPMATGTAATFDGDSTTATIEVGEPSHGGSGQRSVWGAWTAPGSGTVTITTSNSSFNTVLAVYLGTAFANLLPVAQNGDVQSGFAWSSVTFPVKEGATYSFAVDGSVNNGTGHGTVTVNLAFNAAEQPGAEVGADMFAVRPALPSSLTAVGVCDTRLASSELNEPAHVGQSGHSAWWSWIAPTNGIVTIDTLGSSFNTTLNVLVGTNLGGLSAVACNNDADAPTTAQALVAFRVMSGQEYQIMVDGAVNNGTGMGNAILHLSLVPDFDPGAVPGFDAFTNRGQLVGIHARGVANNTFFGLDANEANHGSSGNRTAWWTWTAPASGPVVISTQGSDFDTFVAVYAGNSLTGLQLVASNNNVPNVVWSQVQFNAERGVDYQLVVDGFINNGTGFGNIALSVDQAVPPVNSLAIYPAVEVEIPGNLGVSYQLQASPDLITWQNVGGSIIGTGQPIRVLDSIRGTGKKFYRYVTSP